MDILFENVAIVTMDPDKTVLPRAYLGVTGDKIVYVGAEKPKEPAKRSIFGKDKVLIPGLVNAHAHIAMTALRGFADYRMLIYAIVLIIVMLGTNNPQLKGLFGKLLPHGRGEKEGA